MLYLGGNSNGKLQCLHLTRWQLRIYLDSEKLSKLNMEFGNNL